MLSLTRATSSDEPAPLRERPPENASPLPPRGVVSGSLGATVGNFKSITARRINRIRKTPGAPIWQRNCYEHIVRSEPELSRIRDYIQTNPLRWELDRENPQKVGIDEFDRWLETYPQPAGVGMEERP